MRLPFTKFGLEAKNLAQKQPHVYFKVLADEHRILRQYGIATNVVMTSPNLYLGTIAPDVDASALANAAADGDDTNNTDDEDGATFTVGLGVTAEVVVTNGTGRTALLTGYVDGQSTLNGAFGANEEQRVTVPASGNNAGCQEITPVTTPRRFRCTLSWGLKRPQRAQAGGCHLRAPPGHHQHFA